MVHLSKDTIQNKEFWQEAGIETIGFDHGNMIARTKEAPAWVHFGAGNIFRGFIAALQQTLLNEGKVDTGIIAVSTYDLEIIEKMYVPYDNLSLLAIMHADGTLEKKIIGSIAEGLLGDSSCQGDWKRLQDIFANPSLQIASFTITEKGYSLKDLSGEYLSEVQNDMDCGPKEPKNVMAKIASLALVRYQAGELPIAFVSMDNCSHNGNKLHASLEIIARSWVDKGFVSSKFLAYLNNPQKVSFPWTMIDKITPRPSEGVREELAKSGFHDTEIVRTGKNTFIAPFVNAEKPQYLVVEDHFPNGRMPLEAAGVMFTDKETVEKVEKMKVSTCLNPLHTALAVFGCLLGYKLIADEMKDLELKKLVEKIGYEEGMPVVVHPGILDPKQFIHEVIEVRFPNPYIPDTPQRIATDTSQKVGVRFGETIKAYARHADLQVETLHYIPLAIAGWCRYLLGIDDQGNSFEVSPDPLLTVLQSQLSTIRFGDVTSVTDQLVPILGNEELFGANLYELGLGHKIEDYFKEMITEAGAVRKVLKKHLV